MTGKLGERNKSFADPAECIDRIEGVRSPNGVIEIQLFRRGNKVHVFHVYEDEALMDMIQLGTEGLVIRYETDRAHGDAGPRR